MVYICADDYGLHPVSSSHIQECIDKGALNRVSVFPNYDPVDLNQIRNNRDIRIALHLNLVEGKCMANSCEIGLIADQNGYFKHSFIGLFKLGLLHRKELENQLYKEIRAQVLYWKSILPDDVPFCVDSHQHTHMIPAVFNTLLRVLHDEKIEVKHMRIPAEPLSPFLKAPSLYFTYRPVNIIKQWLLKFLWQMNKKNIRKENIPTSYFCGILFSGKMDAHRVSKILSGYLKMAEKSGKDVELLFHPGYLDTDTGDFRKTNIAFSEFYLSENRKTEFDSVLRISERRVM